MPDPAPAPDGSGSPAAAALNVDAPFYSTFQNADAKKFAEGFKSAEDLAAFGAKFGGFKDVDPSRLLVIPGDDADDATRAAAYEKLGRPPEAKAYGISAIEGIDKEFAGQAEAAMHAAGLSPKQAKALADFYLGFEKSRGEAEQTAWKTAAEAEINQVRQEIGDQKLEGARRFAKAIGLTQQDIAHIEAFTGAGRILKILAGAAEKVGEHFYQDGAGAATGKSGPLQQRMYSNDYIDRVMSGGKP